MTRCRLAVLGSTGSIGQNTLDVVRRHHEQFEIIALSAYQAVDILFEQCVFFKPQYAVMVQEDAAKKLKEQLKLVGSPTQVLSGASNLCFIASLPEVDKVMAAIVGSAGLLSTYSAVKAGKQILLANKETLVMAGEFLLNKAQETGALFLPVDSEHNALFQCFPSGYIPGQRPPGVKRIILTASGGSFLNYTDAQLKTVTPEQACRHPNWKMGKKITVDCSTLINKGLEVIEASRLFRMHAHEIDVLIHPQSIIHSLVDYCDGSQLAQLGVPDMRVPISYCLTWPKRWESGVQSLSLAEIGQLTFSEPDLRRFSCLKLAYKALEQPGMTNVLNASNEVAVNAFLKHKIHFIDISNIIEETLNAPIICSDDSLEDILQTDQQARKIAQRLVEKKRVTI